MTEIAIRPLGGREFLVELSDGGQQTTHRVAAPQRLGGGLELSDDELLEVVRRSFEGPAGAGARVVDPVGVLA